MSSLYSFTYPKRQFLILISFFFLIGHFVFAQNVKEYKGRVLDNNTNDPLALADLIIKDTNISTITNAEGEFLLKVPNNLLYKTVTVSYLGYKQKEIPLSAFKTKNTRIKLEEAATVLAQIDLNTPQNAESLVRKTLKLKNKNYFNSSITMTGFYRETIKKRNKNASLSEAVLEIYKTPYNSNKNDGIRLIKSRKNTNYSRLDTIALKLQGGPFSALHTDIMKYPEFIFTEDNLSLYNFTFNRSTQINDKLVYVVSFKQKETINDALYYGKLFIDADSYALTSATYNLNVENRAAATELFVKKKPRKVTVYPTEASYRVNYRVKDGKWYYGYSNILLTFKVNWKNRLFNNRYTLQSEMAITDWKPNTTGQMPKLKDRIKSSTILIDEVSGFGDPDFWGKYNIIEPEKSIESAIKKISKQLKKS